MPNRLQREIGRERPTTGNPWWTNTTIQSTTRQVLKSTTNQVVGASGPSEGGTISPNNRTKTMVMAIRSQANMVMDTMQAKWATILLAQAQVTGSLRATTNSVSTRKIPTIKSKHRKDSMTLETGMNKEPQWKFTTPQAERPALMCLQTKSQRLCGRVKVQGAGEKPSRVHLSSSSIKSCGLQIAQPNTTTIAWRAKWIEQSRIVLSSISTNMKNSSIKESKNLKQTHL